MGMFDYINVELECISCGEIVGSYQSKDAGCSMDMLDPTEVRCFNAYCKCGATTHYSIDKPQKQCRNTPFTAEEIEELGFVGRRNR